MAFFPNTAAARTRMVRKAMHDAGYGGRVTSNPTSHRAQMTTVDQVADLDAVAAYLTGYFAPDAEVRRCERFVSIQWKQPEQP